MNRDHGTENDNGAVASGVPQRKVLDAHEVRRKCRTQRTENQRNEMAINRINQRMQREPVRGVVPLLPYLTAGFPDVDATGALIRRADALGVAALEIGFPFSDSIADGPVIQHSFHRALQNGFRVQQALDLVKKIRADVSCALIAMVSYTIVQRAGTESFLGRLADAGYDGIIVPDVPGDDADELTEYATKATLGYIGLVAPTTSPERAAEIARRSTGFVYRMAVAGTTGERKGLPADLATAVARLRDAGGKPVCVGFGISTPEHVREVCGFADGAIVGSALVRRLLESVENGQETAMAVDQAGSYLALLATAAGEGQHRSLTPES